MLIMVEISYNIEEILGKVYVLIYKKKLLIIIDIMV